MISVELDETRDYSIEELKELYNRSYDVIHGINTLIEKKRVESHNYKNKFIEYAGRGCMYVTWQARDGEKMFFKGVCINYNLSVYCGENFFYFSAMDKWYVPIDTFIHDVKVGNIKEISKEKFLEIAEKSISLNDEIKKWVDTLVKENNDTAGN